MRRSLPALALAALLLVGCRGGPRPEADGSVDLEIRPQPPKTGPAQVAAVLTGADGRPLTGGSVRLEGNMSHPGMVPVFADTRETRPGRYEGRLELTMPGDWFIIVTATWPDGRRLERQVPVPGVQAP